MTKIRAYAPMVIAVVLVGLVVSGCGSKVTDERSSGSSAGKSTSGSKAASGTAGGKAAVHAQVAITDEGFNPKTVTVTKGGRVVWSNDGKKAHGIVIKGGPSSGSLKPGEVASHVFDTAGTFEYSDSANPSVTAVVIVK